MKIIIHRGSHQIGGIAVEIKTDSTRIIIDMGDELTMDSSYKPKPLNISGVTDENGKCDAVLFTHYHGDHTGQLPNIRKDIPIYMGNLTRDVLITTAHNKELETINRIKSAKTLQAGGSSRRVPGFWGSTPGEKKHLKYHRGMVCMVWQSPCSVRRGW